ncbi:hypothetical protein [Brevundimonas bacteroides]|uniref:hypothetical protein n=1 Tax=Brevundimonas bacteroides TaxID=74311 RepID=UPI000495C7C5|nr:hypothetical protein [Brevundimonas bacteroides]
MLASICAFLIAATGVGLAVLSLLILAAPGRALQALSRFGSTPTIHFSELSLRAVVGGIFVLGAPATRYPVTVAAIGGFLMISAGVLMLIPRRWHARYSSWWAARIPVWAVRLLAPISLLAGIALVWVAI